MERKINTKFFEFSQNNSGGYFDVDENVCHRVIIEAIDEDHAQSIIEPMIENQSPSCSCCGDRWSIYYCDEIEFEKYNEKGLEVDVYTHYKDYSERWFKLYGEFPRKDEPVVKKKSWGSKFTARVYFDNLEQYCQYLANAYGWTTPDVRIHYLDGTKKEIFKTIIPE